MAHPIKSNLYRVRRPVVAASVAAGLAACGGGGGGGGGESNPNPNPSITPSPSPVTRPEPASPTAYTNTQRATWTTDSKDAPAQRVPVGVVDTGFLVNHFEIANQVTASRDVNNTGSIDDASRPHGTDVAQVLAGQRVGYSGNISLLLAKMTNADGSSDTGGGRLGAQWAIEQGARIVNLSWGLSNATASNTDPQIAGMFNYAVNTGSVLVLAAGNNYKNISTEGGSLAGGANITAAHLRQALIVGALDGSSLASYSNYPGEREALQNRFLVASGTQIVQPRTAAGPGEPGQMASVQGTSFAAPEVSAAAATVMSYWPHLKAADVADLLLKTANKGFSRSYSQNTCGASHKVNCGLFYFGQGKLDLAAAMSPVGLPVLPVGAKVEGASVQVSLSSLNMPMALGDAGSDTSVSAAMFDGYGRDFRFNAMNLVGATKPTSFVPNMLSQTSEQEREVGAGRGFSRVKKGLDGVLRSLQFGFNKGNYSASFSHGKGQALDQHGNSPMPLASLAGSGNLGSFASVNALGAAYQWRSNLTLEGRLSVASNRMPGQDGGGSAQRQEVALTYEPKIGTRMSLGYALTREADSMLGASGQGALTLQGSTQQAAVVKLRQQLSPSWTAFAQAEVGGMNVRGSGILTEVSGARTSQWGLGLAWKDNDQKWGLAFSQPVRVSSATAVFDVPIGRDLAGNVLRSQQRVPLAPSGRQVNVELAYQRQLSPLSSFGVNMVYAHDYGHVKGRNEAAVMVMYRKQW